MNNKADRIKTELDIVSEYNKKYHRHAKKERLPIGSAGAYHEFDLFEQGYVIGGVTTGPWKNKTGSSNTAGKDRVSAELLWLTLWEGPEERVIIFTDEEMAKKIYNIWRGSPFPFRIKFIHYLFRENGFNQIGIL